MLYLIFAWPIFLGIRTVLARTGVLRFAWHPALFEFSILLVIIALLILYC
ncbi:DUF1656 domain-containing protein [Cupriavidus metallidurans]|uniref:DUF1656 domain-containing protein n=1 Tax=Cupriavidus metallidurans TaxID=119219 RepID=A0A482J064_9BURK|nr:DUF1656 domain-containing protein [Cupriavidus metallidurans]QBP14121.1 DUF1656 domain-containing protein [Cupriavidus metallidurans]